MSPPCCEFTVIHRSGRARSGILTVRGRSTPTPAFMPVGTQGAVKGMPARELTALGYRALLANTYHLHLRPGETTIARLGGLHRFMDFSGILLTDSGGYQVFSLAERRRIDDDGVTFRSHLDGSEIRLTPETSMRIQHDLDSDISMVLDECPAPAATEADLERAVERSLRWAQRSLDAHREQGSDRAVFAILQGGRNESLRRSMAESLRSMSFDGFALGGIGVGEDREAIAWTIERCASMLPEEAPRYLMGVASPREMWLAVRNGIDLFDCVMPTRNARNGTLFTRSGLLRARNACHAEDPAPIDPCCPCTLCRHYSRAYLRHLFNSGEMLGPILATAHNLTFFARLLSDMRQWIQSPGSVDLSFIDRL